MGMFLLMMLLILLFYIMILVVVVVIIVRGCYEVLMVLVMGLFEYEYNIKNNLLYFVFEWVYRWVFYCRKDCDELDELMFM